METQSTSVVFQHILYIHCHIIPLQRQSRKLNINKFGVSAQKSR